ncbi:hypothetical protein Hdeb2414_s0022g00610121 [Helianthus debilis subsp. tardiflorus]
MWARDIAEKDRVIAHAKSVQEELERKAQKVQERYQALTVEVEASDAKARARQAELEEREGQLRELQQRCDSLLFERDTLTQSSATRLKEAESALDQANVEVEGLTNQLAALRGDRNWLITTGLEGAFEYLRQSAPFTSLIDRLSAAAYQSGHHNGVYQGYFDCKRSEKIPSDFHVARGKFEGEMVDALEAVYNEPLPGYADLVDKVNEEGTESLRVMLDPVEESEEA